jgi:hypothetical protein
MAHSIKTYWRLANKGFILESGKRKKMKRKNRSFPKRVLNILGEKVIVINYCQAT